ncbi:hypothetical protein ANCCEY_14243 [Ancylostoma ceylanicum]|uniref:Uncharacterized protein n=1 Tax=Ancylostoma ceylanicum TaxID=53326 RepID=A0A0D6L5D8_9BILA|nr:hypothetical protein ANCCEY_14243 [Ancylostoma ceylanicum]
MVCAMKVIAFSLLLIATVGEAKPLVELFGDLMKRHTEIKNQQLMQFIYKAVPYGIDPPNPKIAECCNDVVAMEYERRKVANELGRMEGGQRECQNYPWDESWDFILMLDMDSVIQ